jgi:ElaB/YqjD/DUF883 family membrane-anchored ribosome-binding protein
MIENKKGYTKREIIQTIVSKKNLKNKYNFYNALFSKNIYTFIQNTTRPASVHHNNEIPQATVIVTNEIHTDPIDENVKLSDENNVLSEVNRMLCNVLSVHALHSIKYESALDNAKEAIHNAEKATKNAEKTVNNAEKIVNNADSFFEDSFYEFKDRTVDDMFDVYCAASAASYAASAAGAAASAVFHAAGLTYGSKYSSSSIAENAIRAAYIEADTAIQEANKRFTKTHDALKSAKDALKSAKDALKAAKDALKAAKDALSKHP